MRQKRIAIWASVICLSLAASLSGINNRFAFDDIHIIVNDTRTHSLTNWWHLFGQSYWPIAEGGDLYRPLTMLGFAGQWALGKGAPLIFHVCSIALYALVCAAFLGILLEILPMAAAWLGAALFAVHPLHVESVGNVVGQAELLAALFMFIALWLFIRTRRRGEMPIRESCILLFLYLLGCLSKEHAVVLPLLLISAEATVLAGERPFRARIAAIRPLLLALGATGLAFIWVRIQVIGSTAALPGEPNALLFGQPFGVRVMTMLRVVLEWVRLFCWPAQLSADYSPRTIELVTHPNFGMLASVAILVGVSGLAWIVRRTAPVVTFACLWMGIALLIPSNMIVLTGFVLAERTLFVASGGAMLAVAAIVARFAGGAAMPSPLSRAFGLSVVGIVLVFGVVASSQRQRVWRDDDTLFAQTVVDAPASYMAHLGYAASLFRNSQRSAAFEELSIAHALFPKDLTVVEYAGLEYTLVEGCQRAIRLFAQVLAENPRRQVSRIGLVRCLTGMKRYADARKNILQGLAMGESPTLLRRLLRINDSIALSAQVHAGK